MSLHAYRIFSRVFPEMCHPGALAVQRILKEMAAFLRKNTAFFGEASWPVSLRCTACLGKFPNRLSTSIAWAMNQRIRKRNNTHYFAS